jgi:ribosomal peptide maturation radical SAM protein 1
MNSALATYEQHEGGDAQAVAQNFRVALICMPFASARRPSIQLGLVSAIAENAGFQTDNFYFNLDLAAEIGPDRYEKLCELRGHMTGEWLFAPVAFGSLVPGTEEYLQAFPEELEWAATLDMNHETLAEWRRHLLVRFIDNCLGAVDWRRYRVVGFSSTFQQNVASLALAHRLKESYPGLTVVFGGANMEGEMGLEFARAFPYVDHVISGEGEVVFPALLQAIRSNKTLSRHPGLISHSPQGDLIATEPAPPLSNLDTLPTPDYAAYFAHATELGLLPHYKSIWVIPFESSRGCWWGQKHHCTFCGLNGTGMAYRTKTAKRVLAEVSELARRHHISSFEAVDNILNQKYLPEFFPQIERDRNDYQFFYEVKANLTRAQIQTLYRGGVRSLQPGIESMSTHVLQLMRKGCTMLQNVRFLKWCLYYDIRASWNLLCGFPGETREDYDRELDILKCIPHLEPPNGVARICLERFSPYYFDRDTFPVRGVRPEASYGHIYPSHVDLAKVAYFFEYEMGDVLDLEAHDATRSYVSDWKNSWNSKQRSTLTYRRIADGLFIDYNWGPERRGTYSFAGPLATIYEACVESMQTVDQVTQQLRNTHEEYDASAQEVQDAMAEFCQAGLMVSEEGRYLSLAIPSNPNW